MKDKIYIAKPNYTVLTDAISFGWINKDVAEKICKEYNCTIFNAVHFSIIEKYM